MQGRIVSVGRSPAHGFSKPPCGSITLLAGLGVEGDAHAGAQVKHRSRVAADPTQPNLRQVHLFHAEMLAELAHRGFVLAPGDIGENVTTAGLDLLALPQDTLLHLGDEAVLRVTGLRNPCTQLDTFRPGLMRALLGRGAEGQVLRLAGIMAVVVRGGTLRSGDTLRAELPPPPHRPLDRV
ncbi:MOSC domain-containing protein [Pseudoroseomonas wenyumeiae]